MIPLYLDTETYCDTSLRTHGTYRYCEDVEIIMWQYAIGDGEVHVLEPNEANNEFMKTLLMNPEYEIVIHNSSFDRNVIKYAIGIDIPTSRIFDTMACAFAHSLPGSLDKLGEAFKLSADQAKDKGGINYINLFCVPRKVSKSQPLSRATKETHPVEWEGFCRYGVLDVVAMREIYKKLPRWNFGPAERGIWCLDQEINDRGVEVDLEFAHAAIKACKEAIDDYAEETFEMTGGAVSSVTRRDQLLEYILEEYGIVYKDLKSSRVKSELANMDLPEELRALLTIRLQATKTSTAKFKRVINCVNSDRRIRGLLQFCGASRTGRWAGRMVQPQNFVRGNMKPKEIEDFIAELIAGESPSDVMEKCSSSMRGIIVAPKGKKLVVSDLSNIEGRMLAWLAGEEWKIDAFSDFDIGIGYDIYELAYAKAFGVSPDGVQPQQRQVGKTMELALGYGGGVGAFITFCIAYAVNVEEMAQLALPAIPGHIKEEAQKFLIWQRDQGKAPKGYSDTAIIVCDSFKRLWREAHPRTVAYWKSMEATCKEAVMHPGEVFNCYRHKVQYKAGWLRITLPSGRSLSYPKAKLIDGKLAFWGKNQFTQKLEMIYTYGAKLVENTTQAASRDVIAYSMINVKEAGFDIIFTNHDETITETPDTSDYTAELLSRILAKPPLWAQDIPLAAKGFEAYRYRK